ncbi:MAG: hypothetical protein AAFX06_27695 [Planctomycetota bacterium]
MSTTHGGNDGKDVIEHFKDALKQRLGDRTFDLWFSQMRFEFRSDEHEAVESGEPTVGRPQITVIAPGQFAADRLSKNYLRQIRSASSSVCGSEATVKVEVAAPAKQVELPFDLALSFTGSLLGAFVVLLNV